MDTSLLQLPVLCAFGGALAIKLLELTELQHVAKEQRPDFTDIIYWLPFVIMPLLGAGLAYVYITSGVELQPILAANIGVSAPLIIRAWAEINPFGKSGIELPPGA
ncbi:hypothetical protein QA601_07675 [Chitinispirillales bacterium ANBcel5]|uniref:hypothetical protein n=1 Tax=Cellulosispirillum alkaliphilum TaxID=3039283 RepID=UPI002A56B334|nr:hypothetical protein [Chitinispirillales bacterium ANBcel5]